MFIPGAPTLRTPNRNAANKIPIGLFAASRLTAIPSKPIANEDGCTNTFSNVPNPSTTPPSPAKAPEIIIDRIIVRFADIPAYSLAFGFKPTERISNPSVVLFNRNQTNTTAIIAMKIPILIRELFVKLDNQSVWYDALAETYTLESLVRIMLFGKTRCTRAFPE